MCLAPEKGVGRRSWGCSAVCPWLEVRSRGSSEASGNPIEPFRALSPSGDFVSWELLVTLQGRGPWAQDFPSGAPIPGARPVQGLLKVIPGDSGCGVPLAPT